MLLSWHRHRLTLQKLKFELAIFYRDERASMKQSSIKTDKEVAEALKDKTQFERDVLLATFRIPKGKVSTYGRIADKIGRPRASRAVANALHKNPLWPIVPCHRVVCSDGSFGGPKKAAEERRNSVAKEGILIQDNKVKITKENLC